MKVQLKFSEIVILLVVSLMSFAANLPEHFLGNLIDRKMLLTTLVVFVVVAMFRYLRMLLLLEISILAIGANLPEELASALGISQLVLIVSLGFLVTVSLLNHAFKLLPVGTEKPKPPILNIANARHSMLTAISKGDLELIRK